MTGGEDPAAGGSDYALGNFSPLFDVNIRHEEEQRRILTELAPRYV